MCTFRASCCSTCLFLCPGQEKKKKKKGGGSKGGGGGFEVLWNLECHVGLSQKRNMCAFH